ncbi:MAG TPA: alpha-hydroxy-acid oxidizing protein [Thermoleophilaceae bacterium]|nr:alpha-hydroxy-acid oxidizing protein [Thermoleophilaceae bacterium]
MSAGEQPVPFGNYQYEIYLKGLGGETPELPIDYDDLEALAAERLAPEAFHYAAGGAGEGRSMTANRRAFDAWQILPRMLGDVSTRDLGTTVLGTTLPAPLMLGPVGVLSIMHEDAELAVARAAARVGVPMCLSTAASSTMEDVAGELGRTPGWYQLYWPSDPELAESLVRRAEAAGYGAIVVTLDTRMMPWRPRDLNGAYLPFLRGEGIANYLSDPVFRARLEKPPEEDMQAAIGQWAQVFPNPTLGWDDLLRLREWTSLPILVKGVLHPDDARRAVARGAEGVVVSNHGGRQIDGSATPLGQLPAVVDAVGDRAAVLMDGGVRTGSDVLKAVALGADAVLVARSWVWGLGLGGQAGVEAALRNLLADTDLTLAMSGLSSIDQVDRELLVKG